MTNFRIAEERCLRLFDSLSPVWHLYTSENHDIIYNTKEDYITGMYIVAYCAKSSPGINILTFTLMSNHVHFALAGKEEVVMDFFENYKKLVRKMLKQNNRPNLLTNFNAKLKLIDNCEYLRKVIIYINRNGYVARRDVTPISYQWGSGAFFFTPYAEKLFFISKEKTTIYEWRRILHSHIADRLDPMIKIDKYPCPLNYCSTKTAELIYRDAVHYFHYLCKGVESSKEISKEIEESIAYTDEELFLVACSHSWKKYNCKLSILNSAAKIEIARILHYEYNAQNKQLSRILRIDIATLSSILR